MEPQFLSRSEVDRLHAESLAKHGGTAGVRDSGLVDSALGSARNTYWYGKGDLFEVAAAYAYPIAEAQAYLDGNKRTAMLSAGGFSRCERHSCSPEHRDALPSHDRHRESPTRQAGAGGHLPPVGGKIERTGHHDGPSTQSHDSIGTS